MSCKKFPSIEGFKQFKHILRKEHENSGSLNTQYNLTGTVKLHGTHADLVANKINGEYQIHYQSRNRIITTAADNSGCAKFLDHIPLETKLKLLNQVESIFGVEKDISNIFIAGEFCGQNIQKNVGLVQLPLMFVIFGVKINNVWQKMMDYKDVNCEDHRIYNIHRASSYNLKVDPLNMDDIVDELKRLTDEVEKDCPFVKTFGLSNTVGEGIVWSCDEFYNNHDLWFKVKGQEHSATKVNTLQEVSDKQKEVLKNTQELAANLVTESRLCQGIEYLKEMNKPVTKESLGEFVKWIVNDTLKEERDTIAEIGVGTKALTHAITCLSRKWYQSYTQVGK